MEALAQQLAAEMIRTGRKVASSGLVSGTGGNMSVRAGRGVLVTATGSNLGELTAKTVVLVDPDTGKPLKRTAPRPTCEVMVHLACYRNNPDLGAVVHCHPVWTIGVVSGHGSVPPMFPEFVDDVESVGYVDFLLPSTPEMALAVGKVMKANNVCVIQNHGAFCGGRNLAQALNRAFILEDCARAFAIAKLVGTPQYLTKAQVNQVARLKATQYRRRLSGGGGK